MKLQELESFVPSDELEAKELQIIKAYLKDNPNALTRANEVAHLTVSAWVLNDTFDKVLMAYHNIYNSWGWLGGHVDGKLDLCQVAIQEVKEETGIKELKLLSDNCISVEILPVSAHLKDGQVVASHLHFNLTYVFSADEKEKIRVKADENKAVQWVRLEDIKMVVSEVKMLPIYDKIMKRIFKYINKA